MNEERITFFLKAMAIIFLIAGFFIPIYFFSEYGDFFSHNEGIILIPVYFGFVCVVFSALSYGEYLIIEKPSNDSLWFENALKALGIVLIILGILSFLIALSKSSNSFSYTKNMSIVGGIIALLFNLVLAALCIGLSGIHNKYNEDDPKVDFDDIANTIAAKPSYCSNCGKEFSSNMKGGFCEECGNKL